MTGVRATVRIVAFEFVLFLVLLLPFNTTRASVDDADVGHQGRLLLLDTDFSSGAEPIKDLFDEADYRVKPFDVYRDEEQWEKRRPPGGGHGDAMLAMYERTCLGCPAPHLIDMQELTYGEIASTKGQIAIYALWKLLQEHNYVAINLSFRTYCFPFHSLYDWHDALYSAIAEQDVLVVLSGGNLTPGGIWSLTKTKRDFGDTCLLLKAKGSAIMEYLAGRLEAPRLTSKVHCRTASLPHGTILYAGVVDAMKRNHLSRPGKDPAMQRIWVSVEERDLPPDSPWTSEAAIFLSSSYTRAVLQCDRRSEAFRLLVEAINDNFPGYSPSQHGRGVFDSSKFQGLLNKSCPARESVS